MLYQQQRARPLVFIGGKGRSGSTLLSRLLSQHSAITSAGELAFVADRGFFGNQLCSCSEPFNDCSFWKEVMTTLAGESPQQWFGEFSRLKSEVARMRHAPVVLQSAISERYRSREQVRYTQMLEELVAAIRAVTGSTVILDSSKDPIHGIYLSMCSSESLYLIHLVRDCRGVAFSLQRKRVRPEISDVVELMPRTSPRQTALDWDLRNLLIHVLSRLSDRDRRILYEEMVADPLSVRDGLFSWIGLENEGVGVCPASPQGNSVEHEVSGNPMRFDTEISINPDIEWIGRMPASSYLISTMLSAPLLSHYGYHLSRRRINV